MTNDIARINQNLIEILSPEKGYFGRIYTWGQRPTKYEFIGYKLTKDFAPTLQKMSEDQLNNIKKIMVYFEIHAFALKELLLAREKERFTQFYYEVAWSHFMIVIMFGMLEIAVKIQKGAKFDNYGNLKNKGNEIKKFLENNLIKDFKDSITERYSVDKIYKYKKQIKTFSDIIDHLWHQVRSGFIHDAGMESKGLEWHQLEGIGTKDNPIEFKNDVPMQELLQMTWQAIFNSYGYKGVLELPRYKN